MNLRCFAIDRSAYDAARVQLDAALGLPCNGQATALPPSDQSPANAAGRVLLATAADWRGLEPLEALVADMVAAGLCQEIAARQYAAEVAGEVTEPEPGAI